MSKSLERLNALRNGHDSLESRFPSGPLGDIARMSEELSEILGYEVWSEREISNMELALCSMLDVLEPYPDQESDADFRERCDSGDPTAIAQSEN